MSPRKLRVALIDDHALFREGLRVVIGNTRELEVAAEAGTAREAFELFARCELDVAVIDVTLPDLSGVSVARELQRLQPRCQALALTMVEAPRRAAEMLRAGVAGYALKSQPTDEILAAIRAVAAGQRYLAPRLPKDHVDQLVAGGSTDPIAELTPREREVFDLLVMAWPNDRISTELFISTRTVETHRKKIMDKLGVHSIAELVRLAARQGLIPE